MNTVTELVEPLLSERLILRQWIDADVAQFAALNADSQVMEHFPGLLSFAQTSEMVERVRHHIEERKIWGLGDRVEGDRSVHRLYRTCCADVRVALHSMCRSRMAPGKGVLGAGLCAGGCRRSHAGRF